MIDHRLLELLVCPLCKGPLDFQRATSELVCAADQLAFPIRDGMAVMLESEARALGAQPTEAALEPKP